jgi:hypothetical protein
MRIEIPDPKEEGVEIKMVALRAMEDISSPAGGLLVYCPDGPVDRRSRPLSPLENFQAYVLSAYAFTDGWQPDGVVAMGYEEIKKGELFWAIYQGPAKARVKAREGE